MVDHYIKDKAGIEQKVVFHMTRVILISDHYGKGSSDPVWGTGLACVGTAVGISKDSDDPIRVDWDNNRTNIYNPEHLQVYSGKEVGENPNFTFKRAKKIANPCHDERVIAIKAKYGKAMKALDDTESESVMTEKERKEALDLINSTKDTKKEEGKVNKKMSYFNNYMSKPVASTDDDEDKEDKKNTVEVNGEYNGEYDDDGFFQDP